MVKKTFSFTIFMLLLVFLSQQILSEDSFLYKAPSIWVKKTNDTMDIQVIWTSIPKESSSNPNVYNYYLTEIKNDYSILKKGSLNGMNNKTVLKIKNKFFNALEYKMVFSVQEEKIESYVILENLWKQILSLNISNLFSLQTVLSSGTSPLPVDHPLMTWIYALIMKETNMKIYQNQIGVDIEQSANSLFYLDKLIIEVDESSRTLLNNFQKKALEKILLEDFQYYLNYKEIKEFHDRTIEIMEQCSKLCAISLNGQEKSFSKKNSGNYVTVNIVPVSKENIEKESATFSYFVNSMIPLELHFGLAYSHLRKVDFEKVRSLNDQDLFALVKNKNSDMDLTTFLSYGLHIKMFKKKFTIYGTLGTDVKDPGTKLYAGLSFRIIKNVFFSIGESSDVIVEVDESNLVKDVINKLQIRDLYDSITKRRKWDWFVGISFSPF